jgi:integrase
MPRQAAGLTAIKVRTAPPGRYGDGGGLYLQVRTPEARFWLFRYTPPGGKMREMGLGPASGPSAVSLAAARAKARKLHDGVREGHDPLADRDARAAAERAAAQQALARAKTFREVTTLYIDAHAVVWRNEKHRWQWRQTLEAHAFPHMGDLPVADITTAHVMATLEPIWHTTTETASRLRGRIESVLDYAKAREWRSGENPARWRGHIANMLPNPNKVQRVEHHAALPWADIGTFMAELRDESGMAARALEFTILTAARTGEVIGAQWSEIDMTAGIWTVPAARMKAGREHRVPLSDAAMTILRCLLPLGDTKPAGWVFNGPRTGQPLSNMALLMLLRRMKRGDLTTHGFRSTFRDWVAERTAYPREVAEAALAHTLGDKVEAAYRRGDLFDKRRNLMRDWADYCAEQHPTGAAIIPIRGAA